MPSYDIVGDIAVIRAPRSLSNETELTAERLMRRHRNVKTVLRQVGGISGDFRLRKLEWVGGEKRFQTVHKEFGCAFRIDLEKCYFSPRLSHERLRIAKLVKSNETIVNMFAGVGSFSILIARYSQAKKILSIDINPVAVKLMHENARLNRVESKVVPISGDAKDVAEKHLQNTADRVIMPLPEKAFAYLSYGLMTLKPSGGWIHYYSFERTCKNDAPVERVEAQVDQKLRELGVRFRISGQRVVRSTGPNWHQVVLDVHVIDKSKLGRL